MGEGLKRAFAAAKATRQAPNRLTIKEWQEIVVSREKRIAELEAALKPFAERRNAWKKLFYEFPNDSSEIMVSCKDLRIAAEILTPSP